VHLHPHPRQVTCKNLSINQKAIPTRKLTVPYQICHASWHGIQMCAEPGCGSMCQHGLDIHQEMHLWKTPLTDGIHCATHRSWHTAIWELFSTIMKKKDLLTTMLQFYPHFSLFSLTWLHVPLVSHATYPRAPSMCLQITGLILTYVALMCFILFAHALVWFLMAVPRLLIMFLWLVHL
jgi:hypothetical protein